MRKLVIVQKLMDATETCREGVARWGEGQCVKLAGPSVNTEYIRNV